MERLPDDRADEDYFQQIETRFAQLRGKPLVLSTRDMALVDDWWRAGIPLRVVLEAIESVFEKRRESSAAAPAVFSLGYCRHAVEASFTDWKELQLGGTRDEADSASHACGEASRVLADRVRDLQAAAARIESVAAPLAAAAVEVAALGRQLTEENPPPLGQVEESLEAIEDRLLGGLLAALPERERSELEGEAREEVATLRPRMGDRAYAASLEVARRARLRGRYGLPRLTLYVV